ncbi:MAG: diguanylate cyclase and metal dependent phosphohydrolase [Bryobacterales bacterium]|nr:diguanylate cyclase and metal dependent phosphohydrolase [Bryobacterales bacterium]
MLIAGYGTLLGALSKWSNSDPIRFGELLAVAALAGFLQIRLRGLATRLSVRFFVLLISVAVLSWTGTAVIACLSALVESLVWTRPRPPRLAIALHGAIAVLAISAAYATYHIRVAGAAAVPSPLLMVLAAIAYFAVSSGALTGLVARQEHKRAGAVWKQSFFWTFPHYIAGGSAAGLLTIADRHNGWQITVLVVPMLYWMVHAYRLYLERMEQARRATEEFNSLHFRTIESLAVAIEGRDPEHRKHERSVWSDALEIGRQMRLSDLDLQALRAAALLRNVGKLAVPEHILSKPGRLTKAEFDKMKIHPVAGAEIVEQAGFPYPVAPIVRSHHEKWDGTGYPAGLRGQEIPLGARILAAVDCLDALVSTRSYRRAYTLEEAIAHLKAESGKSFDPKVVEILATYYGELELRANDKSVAIQPGSHPAQTVSPIAAARQEVQHLFALAQDLGNSLSLDETFSVLSQHVKQLCPHDTLAVYMRHEDRLEAEYVTGLDSMQVASAVVEWGEGICGRAAATATPLLNEDPMDHPDRPSVGGATSLRSALAIPLEGFSGVAGVLCLYSREKNAFAEDHLRVLSAVATKVAVSVENALKYRQAERSAVTDMLTELPNARSLFLHLDSELARAKRTDQTIAVLVCDLDGFKQINDRFGHLEGNRVLREVARTLRMHCREYDTVARLGGDEFVVVLPGQNTESVSAKVAQLSSAVAQAGYETVGTGCLGISVGVAYYPADGEDAEALLAAADQRMYREKQRSNGANGASAPEVLV